MTLTRVNGISIKQTTGSKLDMAASTPPTTILYEPLIKSNYQFLLNQDVTVLTQLDDPYWLVVVLSSVANSTVRTVVTSEKSIDLPAAMESVHRRSAREVSHFHAMAKTYDSPAVSLPSSLRQKKKKQTKCADYCCGGLEKEDDGVDVSRLPGVDDLDGDDDDEENYTDSASESEDESELELGLSEESEDEDGLEHIKKPSYRRRRETKGNTCGGLFGPKSFSFRTSTSPRMAPQTAVPPPPAAPSSTATAPAGPAASMPYRSHFVHCHHPASLTGAHNQPPPPPPPPGHKTALPTHLAAAVATGMPGMYPVVHAQSTPVRPINVFPPPKSNMPPPPPVPQQQQQQQQQQLRANSSFYPPPPAAGNLLAGRNPRKLPPTGPLIIPAQPIPAARTVSINIHWVGRGSLLVTDNCAPLRRHILDRAMQLARLKSGELGGAPLRGEAAGGRWEQRMMALLKRVRVGEVVHEVTSRVDDLSPLLVGMGPPSKVGFPCFDVEIDLRSEDDDD